MFKRYRFSVLLKRKTVQSKTCCAICCFQYRPMLQHSSFLSFWLHLFGGWIFRCRRTGPHPNTNFRVRKHFSEFWSSFQLWLSVLLRSSKVSLNSVVFGIGGTLNGSISCILWSLALLARKHLFYNESQCQRPEKDLTVSASLSCRGFFLVFKVWIISCNILQSLVFRVSRHLFQNESQCQASERPDVVRRKSSGFDL